MRILKTMIIALVMMLSINAQTIKKTGSVGRTVTVSAYCLKGKMANGKNVQSGYIAADTRYYKMGSKLKLNGNVYTIGDTGSAIKGPLRFDVYMNSCSQARVFGKRKMFLEIY